MPTTCCAVFCSHNYSNCRLKRFPTDPSRALLWENAIKRKDWKRKRHHRICQCHFDASQYENNEGRRLRPDAVPSLFPTHKMESGKKKKFSIPHPTEETLPSLEGPPVYLEPLKSTEADVVELLRLADTNVLETSQSFETVTRTPSGSKPAFILPKVNSIKPSTLPLTTGNSDNKVFYIVTTPHIKSEASAIPIQKEPNTKANKQNDMEETDPDKINRLEKEKSELKREIYRLKKKVTELSKVCQNFNNDERAVLAGKKPKKWSDQTYNKCLEIRIALGKKGYDFLIKQGYPLVSYSALCKYIQNLAEENEGSHSNSGLLLEDDAVESMSESAVSSSSDEEEGFS